MRNCFTANSGTASPWDSDEAPRAKHDAGFVERLQDIGRYLRQVRSRLRFGKLSRIPLQFVRIELRGDVAECEWIARPPDPWDADLPAVVAGQNASLQALEDALAVRKLLFQTLPDIHRAQFWVFRASTPGETELIITGTVTRDEPSLQVLSLAMRAKLCGFRFWLDDGILETLRPEHCTS